MKKDFPHILQTPWWGLAKQKAQPGWTAFFFIKKMGKDAFLLTSPEPFKIEDLECACLVLERNLKFDLRLHYIPRGPWLDWSSTEQIKSCFEFLKDFASKRKAFFIRLEPDVYEGEIDEDLLQILGFKRTPSYIQAKDTVKVELNKTEEDLLSSFHPKHRYNIKLAQKRGLKVRCSNDVEDVKGFYELLVKTEIRHGGALRIHPLRYYQKIFEVLAPQNLSRLYLVEKDNKLVSASMVFTYGNEAIYMYGASDYEARRDMPNHLREWVSMLDARKEGRRYFDLWGVTMRNDPDGGIKRYKLGYCENVLNMAGTFDWAAKPFKYFAFKIMERMRRGI